MIKKIIVLAILIIVECSLVYTQPYYYTSTYEPIEGLSRSMGTIYRINLNDPSIIDTLMTDVYELASVLIDETGNWLVYEDNFHLKIMSINNPNNSNDIVDHSEGIIKYSYLNTIGKLIVRYDGELPNREKMVIIDPANMDISDTIPYNVCSEILIDSDVNFSKEGDIMYVLSGDSILQKPTLISYSIPLKQIISTEYLEDFSLPGSEKDYFYNRQRDFAVIESYYNMNDPYNYYRIYFFHNDSLSIPISYLNPAEAYITNNGKNLVLLEAFLGNDSTSSKPTGKIDIYDMINGELKKTIQLPPYGEVKYFENYPNNLYYTIDIELPTRQIYNLKMDSLLNVLDLTSLSPASKIVNSPPFTLTVNGHGFDTLSTVYYNGGAKTTTYVNDSVLTASISTSDISVVGNYSVWVTDEWGTSDTLMFAVTPQPADLSSLSPAIALTYDPFYWLEYFTITVNGSNFDSSSVVYFGGYARTTTFVSSTVLTFQGRSYDVGVNAHTIPLWVSNGGAISDTLIFSVQSELSEGITPVFFCIDDKGGETITAHLSYNNPNTETIFIPIGTKNRLLPGWAGLPQMFYPGENPEEFIVEFDGNETVWELTRLETTFSKKSDPCE